MSPGIIINIIINNSNKLIPFIYSHVQSSRRDGLSQLGGIIIIIIIIITNEKIKVMLSRKRCRGTSQDYKHGY